VRYGYRSQSAATIEHLYKKSRAEGFGEEVKRRILTGTYVLSTDHHDAFYLKAQKVRRLVWGETKKIFEKFDFLVLPSAPETAFIIGDEEKSPVDRYNSDLFTVHASLAGIPSISIPNGSDSSGLPIGLQVMADFFEESSLYAFSNWYLGELDRV
jgi:aspartyl-tRNA(Asn)/glutamyl-tRNA(Gln) amidotransferase subunit A